MLAIFLVRVPTSAYAAAGSSAATLPSRVALPRNGNVRPLLSTSSVMKDGVFRGILQIAKVLVFGGVGSLPDGRPSDPRKCIGDMITAFKIAANVSVT